MPKRRVADTDLARAIDVLVSRYGSDDKLATELGNGATRFTVMRWRTNGTVPEKPEYVDALVKLGIPADLLEEARATISREERARLARVEDEVGKLRAELDDFVAVATERMAALEATPAAATPRSARRSKPSRAAK